jgi:hypothetical protein
MAVPSLRASRVRSTRYARHCGIPRPPLEGSSPARWQVCALDRRCDVLFDQRAPELRLTASELDAVPFERPLACARRPQLLALTDEFADPFSQGLDVGDVHHQQGRSGRLSIACGNAEESPARCDVISHGTAVDECGAVEDTDFDELRRGHAHHERARRRRDPPAESWMLGDPTRGARART